MLPQLQQCCWSDNADYQLQQYPFTASRPGGSGRPMAPVKMAPVVPGSKPALPLALA